jgi:enoyl-CoA hydratase/carnithine racemase
MNSVWELYFLLEEMERNDDVKVLLWTGEGRAFCSGMSAKMPPITTATEEIRNGYMLRGRGAREDPERDGSAIDITLKGLVLRMHSYAKLSVCAINGLAIGGGLNIGYGERKLKY